MKFQSPFDRLAVVVVNMHVFARDSVDALVSDFRGDTGNAQRKIVEDFVLNPRSRSQEALNKCRFPETRPSGTKVPLSLRAIRHD